MAVVNIFVADNLDEIWINYGSEIELLATYYYMKAGTPSNDICVKLFTDDFLL
jgi:hypothetical protein